jgi:hypothetical protein
VRGSDEVLHTGPVGEVGTAGEYYRLNTTTGKLENGNATTAGEVGAGTSGILLTSVATANLTGSIALLKSGAIVDLGEALAGLAFGASVFISDTDATLADSTGTVSVVVGHVTPGWNSTTADKLLILD